MHQALKQEGTQRNGVARLLYRCKLENGEEALDTAKVSENAEHGRAVVWEVSNIGEDGILVDRVSRESYLAEEGSLAGSRRLTATGVPRYSAR